MELFIILFRKSMRHDASKMEKRTINNPLPAAELMEVIDVELSSEESDNDNFLKDVQVTNR